VVAAPATAPGTDRSKKGSKKKKKGRVTVASRHTTVAESHPKSGAPGASMRGTLGSRGKHAERDRVREKGGQHA